MAHILVVDDDLDFQTALWGLPELRLHEAVMVTSGEQALEALAQKSFDLIVADLMLPGMDGAELIRAIRGAPGTAEVPVVVLTAMARKLGVTFDVSDRTW